MSKLEKTFLAVFIVLFVTLGLSYNAFPFHTKTVNTYILDQINPATVKASINALNDADNHTLVIIHLESPGGDVPSGLALIDAMKSSHAYKVVVKVNSYAASMAAFITAADGENAEVAPTAIVLFHPESINGVPVTATNREVFGPYYSILFNQEVAIYKSLTGSVLTKEEVATIVNTNKEFWLTGKQYMDRLKHHIFTQVLVIDPTNGSASQDLGRN